MGQKPSEGKRVHVLFFFFFQRIVLITCCKSKELERNKEETKREFRNSDDLYFMLIKPIYRLIVRRPKAFT